MTTSSPSISPRPAPQAAPAVRARQAPPTSPAEDPNLILWTRDLPREHGFERLTVEGVLPADLRGTLFRNGPGQFGQFGTPYGHPFEADGAVTAIRLDGEGGAAAVRVTESQGLRDERAAGRILYGDTVSWPRRFANSLRGRSKNTANTNVLWWQGRLFALMEAGLPTEIDPVDLRTLGETDLGVVTSWFSAHPHRVASRRTTYNFGLEVGRHNRLHMYALPDEGNPSHLGALDLDGSPMLHDFIATDDHLIFFLSPVRVSVPHVLLAVGSFADQMRWRPELGTEIICVPIDRPHQPVRFRTDTFFQWHFGNAFGRGRELVVDYVRYPDMASFYEIGTAVPGSAGHAAADGGLAGHRTQTAAGAAGMHQGLSAGRYHRAVIDLERATFTSRCLLDEICEFPKVHPRVEGTAHRYTWTTIGDLTGIGRFDLETGALVEHHLPSRQRVSEPVFVPRAGASDEADGHVLVLCYDGASDRSFLAVFDGLRLPDGPVARLWLDHRVPVTFHGTWAAAAR